MNNEKERLAAAICLSLVVMSVAAQPALAATIQDIGKRFIGAVEDVAFILAGVAAVVGIVWTAILYFNGDPHWTDRGKGFLIAVVLLLFAKVVASFFVDKLSPGKASSIGLGGP